MSGALLTCFDLDDTLVSEREYARSGLRWVSRWLVEVHGQADLERPLIEALEAGCRHRIFDEVFAAHGVDLGLIPACVRAYREHLPVLEPYPDVHDALTHAAKLGPVALLSGGPTVTQRRKLEALGGGWALRFDAIVLTGSLPEGCEKPSGAGFEAVVNSLAAPIAACCYVGDNPEKDFLWPRANGWMTVQIDRPDRLYRRRAPTPAHEALARIETLDELWAHWGPRRAS